MGDDSGFKYSDQQVAAPMAPQAAAPGHLPQPYKFSPDELRILNECNQESFFQRSVPLGTAMGLTTFLAVQRGILKPNVRFGAFPKMTLAVVAGYFIGKLSYQQKCAEKLMALSGSYIGQLLRDRQQGRLSGSGSAAATPSISMFGAGPGDIYSDAGPGSALNLDMDRPIFSGDDSFRADGPASGPAAEPGQGLPPRSALSYDELRRKNRGEYTDSRQDPYKVDTLAPPPVTRAPPPRPSAAPTNQYGDVVD